MNKLNKNVTSQAFRPRRHVGRGIKTAKNSKFQLMHGARFDSENVCDCGKKTLN